MAFLSPEEHFKVWDEEEKGKEEEQQEAERAKKKSGIPDWKIPEVEPLERIFVSRSDWGAGPHVEGHRYLAKPILFVRFWKYSDTQSCTNKEMCKKIVKEIQERHREIGFSDITHNFLLGGDGNVYEGRGWDFKAPEDTRYKHDKHKYLDVAFIGDERNVKYDNQTIYKAAFRLLDFGRKMKIVDPDVTWTWEE